jgi:hypothetical protein
VIRYGGKAVADAAMVAILECPFEETTWLAKFKGTVPDPFKYNYLIRPYKP